MIVYKELHCSPHFEEDLVIESEIKKFVKDPCFYTRPLKQHYQNSHGIYFEEYVYDITAPFFFDKKYWTWFDIFEMEGWIYINTYWKNDHKVMTFIKSKKE